MGKFRDAMRRDLELRNSARSTVDAYLRAAKGLVAFYRRPPDELTREEILHYAEVLRKRGFAPSSQVVHQAGIRFLYRVTLQRPELVAGLGRPKVPKKKRRVLTGSDVRRLLEAMPTPRYRAVFSLLYGCGLRVSEACKLLTGDIDSARHRILVRQGKGAKDRYVPLSQGVLQELRLYYRKERPAPPYLFPGNRPGRPVVTQSFYRALRLTSERLKFAPHVAPHQLRHAYASHQLELGMDINILQMLMGHEAPTTTMHYVTLSDEVLRRCSSPLDVIGTELGQGLA